MYLILSRKEYRKHLERHHKLVVESRQVPTKRKTDIAHRNGMQAGLEIALYYLDEWEKCQPTESDQARV